MKELFYWLTTYLPRKIPTDSVSLSRLKHILMKYYNVPNQADCWLTIYGQLHSIPAIRLRKSYGHLANAAKRLAINKLVQEEKLLEIKKLEARLEEIAKSSEFTNGELKHAEVVEVNEEPINVQ